MNDRKWPEVDVLEQLTSERRLARIDGVLATRLVSITTVFEDLYDARNVAAGMRTCDAFGLQDVHVITDQHQYALRGDVAATSDRWLSIHRYTNTAACVQALRDDGFQIWVGDLQATQTLDALPVDGKIALVVGTEKHGISEQMRAAADQRYVLPMYGMVQSLNVSVALAVSLQTIVPVRRRQLQAPGDMALDRQWSLRQRWLEHGIKHAHVVRKEYASLADDMPPDD